MPTFGNSPLISQWFYDTVYKILKISTHLTGNIRLFSIGYNRPILAFVFCQVSGLGLAMPFLIDESSLLTDLVVPVSLLFGGIVGIGATVVSIIVFKSPWWWWLINLGFPAAVALALAFNIEPAYYFAAFMLLLIVYWNVGHDRVPLYLTNHTTAKVIATLLPSNLPVKFVDLGSGLGATLAVLARARPDSQFTGIENAPIPFAICRIRKFLWQIPNLDFRYGNIWTTDLGSYDVAYCFLSPAPMERLFKKVKLEMRPSTIFISNSFQVQENPPDDIVVVEDSRRTNLLIWRL